ncbi:glycoside hydrolase family 5 protein [Natrarchaeobius sp. A-rgal3]|uniref:glycoside hydrolase family 5 protein n=1 Tax=Natrarchaeobius versutus TaxID=1679078 RepID=UPI0035109C55
MKYASSTDEQTDDQSATRLENGVTDDRQTTRRRFLQSTAVTGALATGFATGATSAAAETDRGIPTPRLHVEGNLIKDPQGNTVTLRGLNIADPKRLNVTAPARGKAAEHVVDLLTDESQGWYPRVIRVPAQPVDIGEHEPGHTGGPPDPVAFTEAELEEYLETHYDPIIEQLGDLGVYAIVDFHRHWTDTDAEDGWDGEWGDSQEGTINEDLQEEVEMFWEIVAPRYADDDHVLYEVYNEPTEPGMWAEVDRQWVRDNWRLWKELAQPWVDTIREHADNIVIVGSPSWSQNPEGYYIEPFEGDNLAYAYHIYSGHVVSQNEAWDEVGIDGMGTDGVYEEVPVFVTEFGWEATHAGATELYGRTSEFADPFFEWLESSDAIHWTAWCADPIWRPVMFTRSFLDEDPTQPEDTDSIGHPYEDEIPVHCEDLPCEWELLGGDEFAGEYVKAQLEAYRDDGLPGDGGGSDPEPEPIQVGEYTPEDTTGDGLHNDFTGDEETSHDVTAFFEHLEDEGIQNNPDAFDFADDEDVGFADVVELLRRV